MEPGSEPGWRGIVNRWCSSSCKSSPAAAAAAVVTPAVISLLRSRKGGRQRWINFNTVVWWWWWWFRARPDSIHSHRPRPNGSPLGYPHDNVPLPAFFLSHTHTHVHWCRRCIWVFGGGSPQIGRHTVHAGVKFRKSPQGSASSSYT